MLRISKMADYATVIACFLAQQQQHAKTQAVSVSQIAEHIQLGEATVSKILKHLTHWSVVSAKRGSRGGYILANEPMAITLAQVISAIEGEPSITECGHGEGVCSQDHVCGIKSNWQKISRLIYEMLDNITIADMNQDLCASQLQTKFHSEHEQVIHFINHAHYKG